MGKRSNFRRKERDFYPTPFEAVTPLIPFLETGKRFWEPCAGNGALIDHLTNAAGLRCTVAHDIEPQREDIGLGDSLTALVKDIDYIITNPPWDRGILHPMIEHFRWQAPTWLLFDADWKHTKQSAPYMKFCQRVISVGRVKWFPDSKMTGKENCAWYLFGPEETSTIFYGRQ